MNCEIFIRSYKKDREWLGYCMRSINKFCKGFSGVTVVVPKEDERLFDFANPRNYSLKLYDCNQSKPMMDCMVQACLADLYCPNADLIFHVDSDCVFTSPVTPETYMTNGLPQLPVRTFESMGENLATCWRKPTQDALGILVTHETMVRHPEVYHRELYASMRDRVECVHGKPFKDYVMGFQERFPWGFAEFPALGMWALHADNDRYSIIDVSGMSEEAITASYKRELFQGWSHWDPNTQDGRNAMQAQREKFERLIS